MFFVVVMPSFLDAADKGLWPTAMLATIYVTVASIIHLAIVIISGTLAPLLEKAAGRVTVARILALALVGVAIWLAWTTR